MPTLTARRSIPAKDFRNVQAFDSMTRDFEIRTPAASHWLNRTQVKKIALCSLVLVTFFSAASCSRSTDNDIQWVHEIGMCGGRVVSSSSTPIMIDRGRSQYDHAAFVFNGEPSFRGTLNCRLYFPPSDLSREQLLVAAEGVDRNGGIVFFPQKDSAQAFALRLERSFNVDQYLASGEGAIACRLIGVEDTTKRDFGPCY